MTDTVDLHVFAEGRVQGVGYREFTRRAAERHGVSGWVRNRSDGAVEAWLRGAPERVDAVVAEMRRGPFHADVRSLRVEPGAASEPILPGFQVRSSL